MQCWTRNCEAQKRLFQRSNLGQKDLHWIELFNAQANKSENKSPFPQNNSSFNIACDELQHVLISHVLTWTCLRFIKSAVNLMYKKLKLYLYFLIPWFGSNEILERFLSSLENPLQPITISSINTSISLSPNSFPKENGRNSPSDI